MFNNKLLQSIINNQNKPYNIRNNLKHNAIINNISSLHLHNQTGLCKLLHTCNNIKHTGTLQLSHHNNNNVSSQQYNTNDMTQCTRLFSTLKLNQLPADPSYRQRDRVGRGPGSGMGKTAKRGHKGQKARNNTARLFEGGQTPLWRRTPKRGFKPLHKRKLQHTYDVLNLHTLMSWIHNNRIDTTQPITLKTIHDNGFKFKSGVKLLARGSVTVDRPIHVVVSDCSIAAKNAIVSAGGSVTLQYHTRISLRSLLHSDKYHEALRPKTIATPPPKYRFKYENQICSGEEHIGKPLSVRQLMVVNGQLTKPKKA